MNEVSKTVVIKSVLIGIIAGAALLSIYFLIVSLANSFAHAVEEFLRIKWWISALIVGFGVQVGLYVYIREVIKIRKLAGATSSVTAAGGISTISMVACCAHHLTDVLPIIGLSAASIFLNRYQEAFLLIGMLSNVVGVLFMLRVMQSNRIYNDEKGFLKEIFKLNIRRMLQLALVVLIVTGCISGKESAEKEQITSKPALTFEEKTNQGEVIISLLSEKYENRSRRAVNWKYF